MSSEPSRFSADEVRRIDVAVTLGDDNLGQLTLNGYSVDTVSRVSSIVTKDSDRVDFLKEVQALHCDNHSFSDFSPPSALALGATLMAGTDARGERATAAEWAGFFHWLDHVRTREDRWDIGSLHIAPRYYGTDDLEAAVYSAAVDRAMTNRRVFVTESGLMGVGPAKMNDHDKVVVVLGSSLPVVLRKEEDHYYVFGTCYVHGIM